MSLFLALLAQVGPFASPAAQPASPLPPELQERRRPDRAKGDEQAPASDLDRCLSDTRASPRRAMALAEKWFGNAQGSEKAQAGHCLGLAFARLEDWEAATAAFLGARDAADADNWPYRARLGAMAGNAALAQGDVAAARAALDAAHGDAIAAGDRAQAGEVALDLARALVPLGREEEAEAALAEARGAVPSDPRAWLLSATLSRRMGKFSEAQTQIEKAAELRPVDLEIGLEAGRIAMLSGREEAARKSWRSVVEASPQSEAADTARIYLEQLDSP